MGFFFHDILLKVLIQKAQPAQPRKTRVRDQNGMLCTSAFVKLLKGKVKKTSDPDIKQKKNGQKRRARKIKKEKIIHDTWRALQ